jgi:hypothetical protein
MSEVPHRARLGGLSLTLLCGVVAILLCAVRLLFTPESYPWLFPDSFDWLVNGLRYSGVEGATFEISHRAMLLPLVYAGLIRLGIDNLIVLFGTLFHCLTPLVVYYFVQKTDSRKVAWWAALLSLLSYTALGQSSFVGSDTAAHFFLVVTALALSTFSRTGELRWITWALIAGAVGVHAQYIGIILAPALVLSLFLFEEKGTMRIGFGRCAALVRSPQAYCAVLLALGVGLLLFLPRLLEFKVLYTERVQHGSLVRFHVDQPLLYIVGIVSSFSWPIALLALIGTFTGLAAASARRSTIFYLLWILDIFLFFSFLYTWKDVRFLLYVTVPVMVLASRGLVWILSAFRANGGIQGLAAMFGRTVCVGITLFFTLAPSTSDPFDYSFALTPWSSATFDKEALVKPFSKAPQIYFLSHPEEGKKELENRLRPSYDELGYSVPLSTMLHEFRRSRHDEWSSQNLFLWTPNISPSQAYILGNRTTLYAQKLVALVTSMDELASTLAGKNNVVIVRSGEVQSLRERFVGQSSFAALPTSAPEFVFLRGGSAESISLAPVKELPSFVSKITAAEYPHALFDGIRHDPSNFTAAPLGSPIQIDFSKRIGVRELKVGLWDFDGRTYRFSAQGMAEEGWISFGEWEGKGEMTISLSSRKMSGVRLVGLHNSNLDQNPENRVFHVLELEITTAP